MTTPHIDVFDTTIHKTNDWLNELGSLLGSENRRLVYRVLRSTLHALRDRLPIEEVAQFGAQLPMLVRGLYYEGWDPTGKPVRVRNKEEFLAPIALALANDPLDAEEAARAVFQLLANRITAGELEDVKHILPAEIRALWP
jgi:uncharacterized protein (DUF2267 family)